MPYLTMCGAKIARIALTLCVLTLPLHGCTNLAGMTQDRGLPPAPRTPGAVVTEQYICIPHAEAAELLLWVESAEARP